MLHTHFECRLKKRRHSTEGEKSDLLHVTPLLNSGHENNLVK